MPVERTSLILPGQQHFEAIFDDVNAFSTLQCGEVALAFGWYSIDSDPGSGSWFAVLVLSFLVEPCLVLSPANSSLPVS